MSTRPGKQDKQEKQPASGHVELNPHARITQQLVRQLKPHLPIYSVEKIAEKMDEIEVDGHRLPLKLFAPHISNDLFPIESAEDLEQKLSDGVRRAIALAQSGFISVGNPQFIKILSTTSQASKAYVSPSVPVRDIYTYGPTPTSGPATDISMQGKGGK